MTQRESHGCHWDLKKNMEGEESVDEIQKDGREFGIDITIVED